MEILCGLPDSFDVGSKLKRPALSVNSILLAAAMTS